MFWLPLDLSHTPASVVAGRMSRRNVPLCGTQDAVWGGHSARARREPVHATRRVRHGGMPSCAPTPWPLPVRVTDMGALFSRPGRRDDGHHLAAVTRVEPGNTLADLSCDPRQVWRGTSKERKGLKGEGFGLVSRKSYGPFNWNVKSRGGRWRAILQGCRTGHRSGSPALACRVPTPTALLSARLDRQMTQMRPLNPLNRLRAIQKSTSTRLPD